MQNNLKILDEIKKVLIEKYGEDIVKIILYGSRSRNDYSVYSDYDVLIITKECNDWKKEREIISLLYHLDIKYDIITDIRLISEKELQSIKGSQPFILNALNEGIAA